LDRSLILVAAPAGFGKSTLLSAWLEASEFPNAWLSLDANDNDLGVFLDYFLGAVRAIYPNALTATRDFLSGVDLPPLTVIARSLLNELDDLERDFALVLDDYHIISEPSVHDLLSALLRNPPKRMHLVIATRQDPPLPLSLLRARAQITEVRGQDLRFSAPEIAEFTEQTLGAPLTDEAIAVLAERTEGWAAGLRLATLTLRFSEKIDSQIARLHAENQFVMDYLIGEVQTHVPLFADLGPRMAGLLARLRRTGISPSNTGQIQQAFGDYTSAAPNQSAAVAALGRTELVELMTERERDVLALLAQRLTNKEIAQALVISPQTVKRHTANIYQKLQANGRREAVANAIPLGLLKD
jgi:ATP/maltotriose-dependent transcriptional regulator MalT